MSRVRPAPERFFAKVKVTDTCWLWTAGTSRGYGMFHPGPGALHVGAHRWSYQYHVGPIPDDLHIDHLCRVRNCVNPAHLEPVTPAENNRRQPRRAEPRTACIRGHVLDAENTYVDPSRNRRKCRECDRLWVQAKRAERQAAA